MKYHVFSSVVQNLVYRNVGFSFVKSSAMSTKSLGQLRSVLVISIFYNYPKARTSLLKKLGPDFSVTFLNPDEKPIEKGAKEENYMRECEILIADLFKADYFAHCIGENIKWIHSTTAGVEPLMGNAQFLEFLISRGSDVPVMTRSSYTKNMVVYCMGHICAHEHNFAALRKQQKHRIWKELRTDPIETKTVGILGVGDVGSGIAAACKFLGMRTIGYAAFTKENEHFDQVFRGDLDAVLSQSDYVINALPSSPKTANLLSKDRFKCTSKCPVFINVGRGSIIDEESVIKSLDLGWIREAVLDVVETEPLPESSRLWSHPGVTITPHISGGPLLEDSHPYIEQAFMENLARVKEDKPLNMVVDYAKGY